MRRCVFDIPGLTSQLTDAVIDQAPHWFKKLNDRGRSIIQPILPAVTMPMQATYTTGTYPEAHGMIANGIATYRDPSIKPKLDLNSYIPYRSTVSFWEQSNELLDTPRIWADQQRKVAMICVQSSMNGAADIVCTPKPHHNAPGGMKSDVWTLPAELGNTLQAELDTFPLKHYWGPLANIISTQWIINAARIIWDQHTPELQWTYLPHMDYDLQRLGPNHTEINTQLLTVLNAMTELVEHIEANGDQVVLISEYGMNEVKRSYAPNVDFIKQGWLKTDDDRHPDYKASSVFAMVDHQLAHIFVEDRKLTEAIAQTLRTNPCVDQLYIGEDRAKIGLNHERSGYIVATAHPDAWFEYRWWEDFANAPEYAWTVDIHRKPGYDPTELFFDIQNKRIHADKPDLVKGSHGVYTSDKSTWPLLLGLPDSTNELHATDIAHLL